MPVSGYTRAAGLLDTTTVRAILHGLRGDVARFAPPDQPDPALLAVVEDPFESAADVDDRLGDLEGRLRARADRRAVFLTVYARMTRAVREGIDGGRFENPDWMRRYLVAFADYYRRAFLAFERGTPERVPDPWRVAFGSAVRGDTLVVQDALLGVNAHINDDLALALADVGIDPDRASRYADHRAVDGILTRLVDAQQAALADVYAAGVADLDAAVGRLDERFSLQTMTEGREQAWRVAVVLTDAGVPPVPSYARWVLRATATGGAVFVLGPRLDADLAAALRTAEREGLDLGAVLARVDERLDAET